MHFVSLDNQIIRHCGHCGASFFEENGINRITSESAEKLAADRQTAIIIGRQKLCPIDQAPLTQIEPQESIPQNITLFRCSKCRGVFSYAEDLVAFKKAQTVKVDYFQVWNKPLPSLKSVLVFSFLIAFTAFTIFTGISARKSITTTQAKDLIGKVNISTSNRYLFLTFTTSIPVKTEIKFTDKTTGVSFIQTISADFKTIHVLTTDKIKFKDENYYQIFLIDKKDKKMVTEEKKLQLP